VNVESGYLKRNLNTAGLGYWPSRQCVMLYMT
jgi:hypothetical protein